MVSSAQVMLRHARRGREVGWGRQMVAGRRAGRCIRQDGQRDRMQSRRGKKAAGIQRKKKRKAEVGMCPKPATQRKSKCRWQKLAGKTAAKSKIQTQKVADQLQKCSKKQTKRRVQ